MNMKSAIPCGLIVNELVSNSFKHGFPDQRSGKISISITEKNDKDITLKVSDNGKLVFGKLNKDDMPFNISISNIENGNIKSQELLSLSGVKSNLQEQIDAKAIRNHTHSHADLVDTAKSSSSNINTTLSPSIYFIDKDTT